MKLCVFNVEKLPRSSAGRGVHCWASDRIGCRLVTTDLARDMQLRLLSNTDVIQQTYISTVKNDKSRSAPLCC